MNQVILLLASSILLVACQDGFSFKGAETTPASIVNPVCLAAADPLSSPFQSGDGSIGDPYTICTADQLNSIGDSYLTESFLVLKDIDLTSIPNFTIIGSGVIPGPTADLIFTGSFDGGGFEISNLTQASTTLGYYGFIGLLGAGGSVTNTNLVDVNINSSLDDESFMGGLAAVSYGTVSDSSVTGIVEGVALTGGLIGSSEPSSSISGSHTNVQATGSRVGGLVGYVYDAHVLNSYALGVVNGVGAFNIKAGGLIGLIESANVPEYLAATPILVTNCYATGNVTSAGTAGGLIASVSSADYDITISKSYATGNVSGDSYVGGFIGYASGWMTKVNISNSFSTGDVSVTTDGGGAFGYAEETDITDFYSAGTVVGPPMNIGGLAGSTSNNTYTDVYWNVAAAADADTSNPGAIPGITSLSVAQLKVSGNMAFDFGAIWNISPTQNNGFPFLR